MKPNFSRAIGALALVACSLFPASAQIEVSVAPGSAERIAKMEAELRTMQEEAAKDPTRAAWAKHELDRMIAEENATVRRGWVMGLSLVLNVVLALALLGVLIRRARVRRGAAGLASS